MMITTSTQSYNDMVDRWVHGAVSRGVTTLNSLLASLPGVYPSVVRDSLQRLLKAGKLPNRDSAITTRDSSSFGPSWRSCSQLDHTIALPVPHPLDYDWRFADAAVTYLLDVSLELTSPKETIALLGAPTVLRNAIESSYPRRLVLLDSNRQVVNCLKEARSIPAQVLPFNIMTDPLPEFTASLVIADPPWYEEHLRAFMWAAARLCQTSRHVLISVPPIGTRPGIDRDRESLFEWADRLGLKRIRLEPGILPYVSPPFEINALKAEGFHAILPEWRRGDLGVFIKDGERASPRPALSNSPEDDWVEEIIDGIRLRVRPHDSSEFEDPRLLTIVAGDVLPSSSRRDGRRACVDVWTSGNRVYACVGRNILRYILRALAQKRSPQALVAVSVGRNLSENERHLVLETAKRITGLVALEKSENLVFAGNCTNA